MAGKELDIKQLRTATNEVHRVVTGVPTGETPGQGARRGRQAEPGGIPALRSWS